TSFDTGSHRAAAMEWTAGGRLGAVGRGVDGGGPVRWAMRRPCGRDRGGASPGRTRQRQLRLGRAVVRREALAPARVEVLCGAFPGLATEIPLVAADRCVASSDRGHAKIVECLRGVAPEPTSWPH